MHRLTACFIAFVIAVLLAMAFLPQSTRVSASPGNQGNIHGTNQEIEYLEGKIKEAESSKKKKKKSSKGHIAALKLSLARAKSIAYEVAKRQQSRGRSSARQIIETAPVIGEWVVEDDADAETSQLTEPRSMIWADAPPPGAAGAAPAEQLRVLNDARQMILPSGGLAPSPPTVDFVNAADLSYWTRVDLQQGLGEAFFEPQYMASTFDGARLVVAARGSDRSVFPTNPVPPHLAVIDAVAGRLDKRIQLEETFWPVSVVISPDGRTAYVSTSVLGPSGLTGEQMVLLVNLESGAVTGRVDLPPGGRSGEIVMTPDGALLFVLANLDTPFLYAIDTRTQTVIAQIGGLPGQSPSRRALREATEIAIDPFGAKVYVGDAATPQSENDFDTVGIAIVDVATATVTGLVPLPGVRRRGSADDLQIMENAIIHLDGVSGLLTFIDPLRLEVIGQRDIGDALFEAAIARTR
jgi:DNA-binding beta-propeller fold protein YncE